MTRREEIRIYDDTKEAEADYDRFREEWTFDAETQSGEHQSGLQVKKAFFGSGLKTCYINRPEWGNKLKAEGLTPEEINLYGNMLHDQFYVLCLKNPQPQRETTLEERVKVFEEIDQANLKLLKDSGCSKEKLKKTQEFLDANRESRARMAEVYKNGNKQSDR